MFASYTEHIKGDGHPAQTSEPAVPRLPNEREAVPSLQTNLWSDWMWAASGNLLGMQLRLGIELVCANQTRLRIDIIRVRLVETAAAKAPPVS